MKIDTPVFGEIKYDENEIITFDDGLYGLPSLKKFVFIENNDENFHFHWLQALEDTNLVFIVTSPFIFVQNYDFEVPDGIIEKLGIEDVKETTIFSIVRIPEEVSKTSLNLKAPIIINSKLRKGRQIILNEDFEYKYYIFDKSLNERK